MKLGWNFNKVNPRFKNREATQGEFFASDTDLRAFVREALQNSLDARNPNASGPVAVRIFLSGETYALPPDRAATYLKGGWNHFRAKDNGLQDAPTAKDSLKYIVFEDSGTTGLTGDVDQYHEVPDVRNPFYYFFRAEGQSNKSESDRGRWGLGKFVFPRCSRIRSFFAVTVRHDDHRRLLVGQSILRSHRVKDRSYTPDGWFGLRPTKSGVQLPVEESKFIDQFEIDFCLERKSEPGLSVVIPYCDDSWTADLVAQCITEDYFQPILNHELVVTVEGPGSELVISAESMMDVVRTFSPQQQANITPLLELVTWGMGTRVSGLPMLNLHDRTAAPKWSKKLIPDEVYDELRERYSAYEKVAVRIPVMVRQRGTEDEVSHFDIFLEKADGSHLKRPLFIREGILISDVRSKLTRELRSIVCIEDSPLARLLGDAENPSHTEWSDSSAHFKGKYVNGLATIRFVKNAVTEICQMLARDPSEEDPRLLLDVFSIATDNRKQGYLVDYEMLKSAQEKARIKRPRELIGESRPKPFRVRRRKGGFRIFFGDRRSDRPQRIEVKVAYDRRNGNPLKKYAAQDFDIDRSPIEIHAAGASVDVLAGNQMMIDIQDDAFDIAVTGFDANRDLFLDVKVREANTTDRSRNSRDGELFSSNGDEEN